MQMTMRHCPHDGSDLLHRLDNAKLAVHGGERHKHGILSQPGGHIFSTDAPIRADGQHVNLISTFLQGRQASADRGMLKRRGDDVMTEMPGGIYEAVYGRIVSFTGTGGENKLPGTNAKQLCACCLRVIHPCLGGFTGRMVGIGISDTGLL